MLVIESAGLSDVGQKRKGNEDSFCVDDTLRLYVVADGMGGHNAGEIASRKVVESLQKDLGHGAQTSAGPPGRQSDPSLSPAAAALASAIHRANQVVFDAARANPAWEGMGATVSAVCFTDDHLIVANVGDSPVYLVRDGQINLQSTLHTFQAEQDALAKEGARKLGEQFRHMLTRAMGTKPTVQPDIHEIPCRVGDTVVISSDGLTDLVQPREILKVVTRVKPKQACRLLVELANKRGGHDNITVIVVTVVRLGEATAPAAGPPAPISHAPLRVDFDTEDDSHQGSVRRLDADAVVIETAEPFSENEPITVSFPLSEGNASLTLPGRIVDRGSQGITVRFEPALTQGQKKTLAAILRALATGTAT